MRTKEDILPYQIHKVSIKIMRFVLLSIFLKMFCLTASAQAKDDIESILTVLNGESEYITKDTTVDKLLKQGVNLLPILSKHFTDSTKSKVFSKCVGRLLTKGELAIIIADRIEGMPYFTLTGMQNCTWESCNNNPNFVEYYLQFIRFRGMTERFQKRYDKWLASADRRKYRK